MDGHAQVKGLIATTTGIAVCKFLLQAVEQVLGVANALTFNPLASVFQCFANFFTTRYFAYARVAARVSQDQDVACEEGAMSAAEVQQHAVPACDGNDLQFHNGGGVVGGGHRVCSG